MGELEVFLAKHGGQISAVETLQVQDTSGSQLDDQSNVIVPTNDDVLDTAQVSGKVLLLLQLYRIPIAQFGLHVLQRSPSRTSELLNKPKSFENLSQDGREVYRKMKRWLEQEGPIAGLKRKIQGSQTDDQQSNVIVPAAADVLDTAQVSGKVLNLLQLYKIPISQFGLHVLERSQGRTSELLNKPKPFEKLSQDGREVYRKMKRWLEQEDPIGYVRRKIVQGKRKRGQSTSTVVVRTKFSVLQRIALEALYKDTKYPAHGVIEEFANSYNLDSRTVRIWFNNKRQRGENSGNAAASVESDYNVAESKELI